MSESVRSQTDTTIACPLCGSDAPIVFRTPDRNRRVSDQRFDYRRCSACGLIFLADPPTDLAMYYADDYHGSPDLGGVAAAAVHHRHQIDLVRAHVSPGRLVEIGPAWGIFLLLAKEAGFEATGIEMEERCCAFLRTELGVDAICSDRPESILPTLPASQAIVMWQSLEHLRDPWACLRAAAQNLADGGVLVVGTPNPESLGLRLMRGQWPHIDAPRHLWLIPVSVLTSVLRAEGLVLETVTSRDQDAKEWNRFAWQRAFENARSSERGKRIGAKVGGVLAASASYLESRGMNGSTYTAVFRRRA